MRQTVLGIIGPLALSSLALSQMPEQPLWLRAGMVEQAVRLADAAFLADLEWYALDHPSENETTASGRVIPVHAIWGGAPTSPFEIGRQYFVRGGSQVWSLWGGLVPGEPGRTPVVVLSVGNGAEFNILHVVRRNEDDPRRQADDLSVIRALEFAPDSTRVREDLIQAVIAPGSTELLWSYALRKLYRLDEDLDRRFDLVLHPRIQESSPFVPRIGLSGDRLRYAIDLLRGYMPAGPEDYFRQVPPKELRHVYTRLLDVFANAPSEYMARTAIIAFNEQNARKAEFTDQEWEDIRERVREAIANSEHPIHRVAPEMREWVNGELERLIGEPNLLRAVREDRAPSGEE